MKVISGLFPNCVLQRTARNRSNAHVLAEISHKGALHVSVSQRGRTLPGFRNKEMGAVREGRRKFRLSGIPQGGPYRVELTVRADGCVVEKLIVSNVMVGDVWIAAGQSNMEGIGRLEHAAKPVAAVRAFTMDDCWSVARDPIHNMWDCVDQVHIDLCGGTRPQRKKYTGTGPAVAFAQEMWRRTGVPQGVLACAHNSTCMDQWDPSRKKEGSKSLYGALLRRLEKNGGQCSGMIWYQGESDTFSQERVSGYTKKMTRFLRALRHDAGDLRLPVALVQIGRVLGTQTGIQTENWNSIQDQQRRLPARIPYLAVVPAIDLRLDDAIHIGGPDVNRLGRRLAQAMCALQGKGKPPISLKSITQRVDPVHDLTDVLIEFDHVVGRLGARERAAGFAATGCIIDTRLEGSRVVLKSGHWSKEGTQMQVSYGRGTDPYCNITDEDDRSLPVFGPITIGKALPITPFVNRLQVSEVLPGAESLHHIEYPGDLDRFSWRVCEAEGTMFAASEFDPFDAAKDQLVYFRCCLEIPEPMKLAARLGYHGPIKVWIGDREIFHNPKGGLSFTLDRTSIPFPGARGAHTVLIALGSNHGRARAASLRFERLDVPKRSVRKDPAHNQMPTIGIQQECIH